MKQGWLFAKQALYPVYYSFNPQNCNSLSSFFSEIHLSSIEYFLLILNFCGIVDLVKIVKPHFAT